MVRRWWRRWWRWNVGFNRIFRRLAWLFWLLVVDFLARLEEVAVWRAAHLPQDGHLPLGSGPEGSKLVIWVTR